MADFSSKATSQPAAPVATAGTRDRVVVVDLSPEPAKAKVVREGYQVPAARLDPQKTGFLLDSLPVIQPKRAPRVLAQSIAPGIKVSRGTAVDLVLASAELVPFEVFDKPHIDLVSPEYTVNTLLDTVLQAPDVRKAVLTYERAGDVPDNARQLIINAYQQHQIPVTEDDEERNFERAFDSARNALAFK